MTAKQFAVLMLIAIKLLDFFRSTSSHMITKINFQGKGDPLSVGLGYWASVAFDFPTHLTSTCLKSNVVFFSVTVPVVVGAHRVPLTGLLWIPYPFSLVCSRAPPSFQVPFPELIN